MSPKMFCSMLELIRGNILLSGVGRLHQYLDFIFINQEVEPSIRHGRGQHTCLLDFWMGVS